MLLLLIGGGGLRTHKHDHTAALQLGGLFHVAYIGAGFGKALHDAMSQLGYGIMQRFAEACADAGNVEKPAKMEGRSMIMFMNAKPAPANKQ